MTNDTLQKYLARFPLDCEIVVQMDTAIRDIDHIEVATGTEPMVLTEQNVGWADLIKPTIRVRLCAAPATKLPTPQQIEQMAKPRNAV